MRLAPCIAVAAMALVLAACQGSSFGSGIGSTGGGMNPPVNQQPMGQQQGMPGGVSPTPVGSVTPSAPPGQSVTYPFAEAPSGLKCPEQQGFSCEIRFNATPAPSPSAKATSTSKGSPTPSPTPTATPTPSPSPTGSGLPSPSPTPTGSPTPNVTLTLGALPKDAPPMTNGDPKAVSTTALVTLRMRTNADVEIQGNASADFMLPKEQIGGRIYAVQLYHEDVDHKKKVKDTFFGAYSQSKLTGNMLRFEFSTPKIDIKKNETWLFVLYGAEDPSASGAPTYSPSPSASGSGSSSSAAPSAAPSSSQLPPGSSLNALPSPTAT